MSHGRHALLVLATAAIVGAAGPAAGDEGDGASPARTPTLAGRLRQLAASARARLVLERPLSERRTGGHLARVLDDVRHAAQRGETPVVVFDIDDTVLHSLADPASGRRTGKTDPRPEPDQIEGAVAFANELAEAGATIVYMTAKSAGSVDIVREQFQRVSARDAAGRRVGLPRPALALYHDGAWGAFRPGSAAGGRHRIVFTEKSSASKQERLGALERQLGREGRRGVRFVAAFDNEKANAMMFARELPGARVFRVKTISKYRLPRPALRHLSIRTIADFAARQRQPARARPARPRR